MENKKGRKFTTYQLVVTALMAAVMCALGPLSVPVGPIPVSFTNLVIFFSLYLLGTRMGTAACIVYLLLGTAGLPVFSGFVGGAAKLAGPTGGYLIGFIPMAAVSGLFIDKSKGRASVSVLGMALGAVIDYALGTAWFVYQTRCGIVYALSVCVLPFLIGDGIKIALAAFFGAILRRRLTRAGLLR